MLAAEGHLVSNSAETADATRNYSAGRGLAEFGL